MSAPEKKIEPPPTEKHEVDRAPGGVETTPAQRVRIADLLHHPFNVRSIALTGLFVLAAFYTMYFMRSVLLPVVLALLLSYLFRPLLRAMGRWRIPPGSPPPSCWWA